MSANRIQHKVNHVALVVDCSGSMYQHQSQLIRVVDEFVAGLKAESDSLGHETRISLYSFDHRVENLVWDMDVKHLPSMRGLYKVNNGATALIEASLKSLDDLGHIWEEYGEHSFLQIVVTDGEENASGGDRRHDGDMAVLGPWLDRIAAKMGSLPGHWTSAILVPNSLAKRTAQITGSRPATSPSGTRIPRKASRRRSAPCALPPPASCGAVSRECAARRICSPSARTYRSTRCGRTSNRSRPTNTGS
ncbi:conserved hypothetical protein [Streptomyces pristinaespiralis ATCC 25486]|uniref:VWFA domain-containing protein n=1 Tax=Streptomyces pristinaespiralis (strain ATCC 25486 / DSM 40338 / CBS 914.69 / JCM 4507 / KCC S-0507 / NBRC 13074 / NRRL 2958 / 5647) TaxID=457429 RepID=D6X658_STRE2|nr:conserved hypothetical protein [Streptomyces pristinaespiralis ATCC 25486]